MTDDDALICANPACEHLDTDHDEKTGICLARGCRCVCFRLDWEDEDEEFEELDFDQGAA